MIWLPVTLCFGFPVTLLLHNSRFTCVLLPEALKYGKPLQVAHRDDNARAMLRKIRKSSNFHTELKLQYVYFHYWNLGVQSQKLNFANSSNFSMDLPDTILTKATGFLPEFSENGLLVYHLATFILNKLLTRKNDQNEGHFWRSQLELINVFFKWWPKWHSKSGKKHFALQAPTVKRWNFVNFNPWWCLHWFSQTTMPNGPSSFSLGLRQASVLDFLIQCHRPTSKFILCTLSFIQQSLDPQFICIMYPHGWFW